MAVFTTNKDVHNGNTDTRDNVNMGLLLWQSSVHHKDV